MAKDSAVQDRLREAVRSDGRTQAAIARASGLTGPNLTAFLKGRKGMGLDAGVRLARVLGIELVGLEEDPCDE